MTFTKSRRFAFLAFSLFFVAAGASASYLGVGFRDMDADQARELKLGELYGVHVVTVQEGAPADQAGVRPGDVILSYNGEKVLGAQQLIRLVAETPPGRRVNLVCWRLGEKKQLSVTTGSPQPVAEEEEDLVAPFRITDVPSTLMLWRNLVLGIESQSLNDQLAQAFGVKKGILIWQVAVGSPAQHAGLRAGDILTDFCGHVVESPRQVGLALQQWQSSQRPMSMNVIRDHKPISLQLSLDVGAH